MLLGHQIGPVILTQILEATPVGILCKGYEVDLGPSFPCVVRVLPPQLWGQQEAINAFLSLMRWHRKVLNPSIARCLYCDEDRNQGSAWAVLEWMESEALHDVQRSFKGQGNVRRILDIARQMTSCVELLHRAGRVHGRLRLEAFRRVSQASSVDLDWIQLHDLGLGLRSSSGLRSRALQSTAEGVYPDRGTEYLPPTSQAIAGLTAQSDVYALIVCMYCLISGQPPQTFQTGVHALLQTHQGLASYSELVVFMRRVAGNPLLETPTNGIVLQHRLSELQDSLKLSASSPGVSRNMPSLSQHPAVGSSRKLTARPGRNLATQSFPPPLPSSPNPNDSFIPFLNSVQLPSQPTPTSPIRSDKHRIKRSTSSSLKTIKPPVSSLSKSTVSNLATSSLHSSSSHKRNASSSTFASRAKPIHDALEESVDLISSGVRALVRRRLSALTLQTSPQSAERTFDALNALAVVSSAPSSSGSAPLHTPNTPPKPAPDSAP